MMGPDKIAAYKAALDAVSRGMPMRMAATVHGVNRESLRNRVQGHVPVVARRGPQLVYLSEGAEAGLVEVIRYRALHGMCIGPAELRYLIREAALHTTFRPVGDDFPNDKYVQRWMKRHEKSIGYRKGQVLDVARAKASTNDAVLHYYDNLKEVMETYGLLDKPAQVWNCDETGICARGQSTERVICPRGMVANVQRSADRENVSVMGCVSAAGASMPPMYIFAGARRKIEWMEGADADAVCAVTKSSNINGTLFLDWFKWFVSNLPVARPQLLILDGHFSHIQQKAVAFGEEEGVHIFVLPAHTSHFLQPLDVTVFKSFKTHYEKALAYHPLKNEGSLPSKDTIAAITKVPWELAFSEKNVRSGFRRSGIFPLSLKAMMKPIASKQPSEMDQDLRHHAAVLAHVKGLEVSSRQRRILQQLDLNVDTLNVVNLAAKSMVKPRETKRVTGTFLDENFSGGRLLTLEGMKAEAARKKADKIAKQQQADLEKQERKNQRDRQKLERNAMNCEDKPLHQTAATRKLLGKHRALKRRAVKAVNEAIKPAKKRCNQEILEIVESALV